MESEAIHQISSMALAKKIAFVSTEKIHQDMITCEEIVRLGRYPHTGSFGILTGEDIKKAEHALKLVNAYDIRDKDYRKISDGQKQKIRIAMAICQEPDIIVLDEPTSFLDIRHKTEILEILRGMADRGTAVIMSLHELELVRLVADKILCVDDGKVMYYGECEAIYKDDFINRLFHVENGGYAPKLGTVFMKKCETAPKVFVIGGNGAGIPVYMRLNKQKIPFATGILQENDCDACFAREMTKYVVCTPPFENASDVEKEEALKLLDSCDKLIVAQQHFGTANRINESLLREAEKRKMEII